MRPSILKTEEIRNPTFAQHRVPQFKDTPVIQIIQLNRPDLPSAGAGEPPIAEIAPAIRNAIADATGLKLKTLPLAPNDLLEHLKKVEGENIKGFVEAFVSRSYPLISVSSPKHF